MEGNELQYAQLIHRIELVKNKEKKNQEHSSSINAHGIFFTKKMPKI